MSESVVLTSEVLSQILDHARRTGGTECCGLLAGRDGLVTQVFQGTNVASKPATSYEIVPEEIFRSMREMRAAGQELLGIYHSHPKGLNEPSPKDIQLAYYPDAAYFIVSPLAAAARPVRAFLIRDGRVTELEIQIE